MSLMVCFVMPYSSHTLATETPDSNFLISSDLAPVLRLVRFLFSLPLRWDGIVKGTTKDTIEHHKMVEKEASHTAP